VDINVDKGRGRRGRNKAVTSEMPLQSSQSLLWAVKNKKKYGRKHKKRHV